MNRRPYRRLTIMDAAARRFLGDVLIFVTAVAGVVFIIINDVPALAP